MPVLWAILLPIIALIRSISENFGLYVKLADFSKYNLI